MDSSAIADRLNCGNQGEIGANGCAFPDFPVCHSFDWVDHGALCYLRSVCYRDSLNELNRHTTIYLFHVYRLSGLRIHLILMFILSECFCNG